MSPNEGLDLCLGVMLLSQWAPSSLATQSLTLRTIARIDYIAFERWTARCEIKLLHICDLLAVSFYRLTAEKPPPPPLTNFVPLLPSLWTRFHSSIALS